MKDRWKNNSEEQRTFVKCSRGTIIAVSGLVTAALTLEFFLFPFLPVGRRMHATRQVNESKLCVDAPDHYASDGFHLLLFHG